MTNPPFKRRRDAWRELMSLARHGWLMPQTGKTLREHGESGHLVVFLHGYFASGGVFKPMATHLASRASARRQLHFTYLPMGRVSEHAERLVESIQRAQPEGPVCVVAHSLGGLIARYAAQVLGQRVDALVTLGTPHRGTPLARQFPLALAQELSPGSRLLRTLSATRERLADARLTSVVAVQDALVPSHSAVMEGARAVYVDGVGHHGMLFHREVWEAVDSGIRLDEPPSGERESYIDLRVDIDSGEHPTGFALRRRTG